MKNEIVELGTNEWSGTLRVYNLATKICRREHADLEIVAAAAILHDLGKIFEKAEGKPHYIAGQQRKIDLLTSSGYSGEEIKRIINVVENHQKKSTPEVVNLESAVLQDADSIDELGLIGLIRSAIWHGKRNDPIYFFDSFRKQVSSLPEVQKHSRSIVDHQFDKLLALDKFMNTQTGQLIAKKRIRKMRTLLSQLKGEVLAKE